MQVLIPISSRTQFFPIEEYFFPKPLIDVDGKPMIERVITNIKSYVADPKFIFVIDSSDILKFSLDKLLIIAAGTDTIVVQKKLETSGALCSCLLAIDSLDFDEPLIIANCDTLLTGNIKDVSTNLINSDIDAGVFTFDSIHPRWSYVREGSTEEAIAQVYEKEVVSNNAIAGIYYFKKASNFINCAKKVILDDISKDGVFYISSTINQIILTGGLAQYRRLENNQVFSFYSPKAIDQYLNYLVNYAKNENELKQINVVIPAAGLGSRFSSAGWKKSKPFIDIGGTPMISHVINNLDIEEANYTILFRDEDVHDASINTFVNEKTNIISVPNLTEGTACTVLAAEQVINNENMLLIANSDQIVDCDINCFVQDCLDRDLDGSILVFRDKKRDPKWSFASLDENLIVNRVEEKIPISDLATVGIYLFKTGASFVSSAIEMIVANDRVNNEFYTCPVYNYLIKRGCKIGVYEINQKNMHGIGTPDDLNIYLEKFNNLASKDAP
jgi:dTDP-glucose pyrophosphorylase